MSKQVRCTPLVPLESFLAHMCICCMAIPTPHIISIIWPFSRLCLSSLMWAFHTPFWLPPLPFFLVRHLGVNFLAHAHPLHECSKCRKGVDHFDLYLASGLGMSQDKIPKKTKCETLVDWVLNIKILFLVYPYPLSCTQTPFGDIRVTDSESSCTFMFLCYLFQY